MNDHMMEEIDFLISGVKYDKDGIIEKVSVHEKVDKYGVGYPFEESRKDGVRKIKDGKSYFTLTPSGEGKFDYTVDEKIELIDVDGKEYIRIDDQKKNSDELGDVTSVSDIQQLE